MSDERRDILRRALDEANIPSAMSDLAASPSVVRDETVLDEAAKIFDAAGELEKIGALIATASANEAMEITFREFSYGGYAKGQTHRLTIQRLSDTEVPAGFVPEGKQLYGDELVAILNDQIFWLENDEVFAPNALLGGGYAFQKDGQEVVLPLFAILPPAAIISEKTNSVIIATRYPANSLSVQKTSTLRFPRGSVSPGESTPI